MATTIPQVTTTSTQYIPNLLSCKIDTSNFNKYSYLITSNYELIKYSLGITILLIIVFIIIVLLILNGNPVSSSKLVNVLFYSIVLALTILSFIGFYYLYGYMNNYSYLAKIIRIYKKNNMNGCNVTLQNVGSGDNKIFIGSKDEIQFQKFITALFMGFNFVLMLVSLVLMIVVFF